MNNDCTPLPPLPPDLDPTRHLPDLSITIDSKEQAWQRLITRPISHDELPSLIETIFSGGEADMVDRLGGNDAQNFIDIMDEVHHRTLHS